MIRYQKDWSRFPTATIHHQTKNRSFVALAALYKKMGIKNAYFHLSLLNPALANLDPHSRELTEDQKVAIAVECEYNVWYFLREVCRIPPNAGNVPISYAANRGNIALTWLFMSNVDVALIQPRQTGKSVSTDALMTWLLFCGMKSSHVVLITKDHSLRVGNIERLKKLRDLLPKYIYFLSKDDANNQVEITNKSRDNDYQTKVAQNSLTAANNTGRGATVPVIHCDEGPFINYIGETLPAALAAATEARNEAERNGQPYGNIYTTTAGKKDDKDGRFMYDMISGGAPWSETFLDCEDRAELWDRVEKNCRGHKLIVNCTFSHRQLGKSDEWLYKALSNAGGTPEQNDRDFFNIWTSGSQRSPLSVALNEAIKASDREPEWTEVSPEGFMVRWYVPESQTAAAMSSGHYVIGLDTSDAVGRDDIAMVVQDLSDMSVVAAGNFNETSMLTFSNFLTWFMAKYQNTVLVIERKSTGGSIIGNLCIFLHSKGIDPYKRIFNWVVENKYERLEDYRDVMQDMSRRGQYYYDSRVKDFGFVTTGANRDQLFGANLQEAAKKAGHLVRDKILSDQIRALVVKRDRIDHLSSGHDDSVVAWLLGHWFAANAKFLDFYGIDPKYVLSRVSDNAKELTAEEVEHKVTQSKLRAEIEEVIEQLQNSFDATSQFQLEGRLKALYAKVEVDGSIPNSLSELLTAVQERRRMTTRMQSVRLNQGRGRGYPGRGARGGYNAPEVTVWD